MNFTRQTSRLPNEFHVYFLLPTRTQPAARCPRYGIRNRIHGGSQLTTPSQSLPTLLQTMRWTWRALHGHTVDTTEG